MANDNNNINELATDDDPTVELKQATFRRHETECDAKTFSTEDDLDTRRLTDASTSSLKADLRSRDKTISRLQHDLQQLQTERRGAETENNARTAQTEQLNTDLAAAHAGVLRKQQLIKKRDRKVRLLKSEIRQRDEDHQRLSARCAALQLSVSSATVLVDGEETATATPTLLTAGELELRLSRSENYADSMRMQLQDLLDAQNQAAQQIDGVSSSLQQSRENGMRLVEELRQEKAQVETLQSKLTTIQEQHENEIRLLRFDLGEAQDTVVETGDLNSQLTSDLVDARNFKAELEHMLANAEQQSNDDIDKLQKKVRKLTRTVDSHEQKLSTKSEAISVLLAELAKKAERDSMDEIEEKESHTSVDRTTRVLIGTVDDQVLRFPLFKDRLTVGRTSDNDIQLKAAHVSRRHAVIQTDGDTTRVIDWGSKNGIRVNSKKISEHCLKHGDVVVIGEARFRYEERKKRES